MNSFSSKLKLKEMAEEDIYFAKRDQELIEALRKKKRAQESALSGMHKKGQGPKDG